MMNGCRGCRAGGSGRFPLHFLLILLLLASPGLGSAGEDPAPPNAVPPTGEGPAFMKAGAARPENGESSPKAEGLERPKRLLTILT